MIGIIFDVVMKVYDNKDEIRKLFGSKYLNYDVDKLLSCYSREKLLSNKIPYTLLYNFMENPNKEIVISKMDDHFKLCYDDDIDIKSFQVEAYNEFKRNGKFIYDDHTVSLRSIENVGDKFILNVQQSKYSDQVQSHLVLDWINENLENRGSLRGIIKSKYTTNLLPSLDCPLLSNSLGISTIIYFKGDNGELVPYLPYRNKSKINAKRNALALYEGVYHCSSSGVLKWTNDEMNMSWIEKEMYREIHEEIGLEKLNIVKLKPIAIVRELLRAGKPQIFFIGYTDLKESELVELRKNSIKGSIANKDKKEIRNKHLSRKKISNKNLLSLEAIGNLCMSEKYKISENVL